ncbi:MAG: glycosyltransferase [Rikenellaceae bacterium]
MKGINTILFLVMSIIYSLFTDGKIMVFYFKGCIYLKRLLSWKKMILDIRTLSISNNLETNRKNDASLRKCAMLYDFSTIISEGIREKLDFPKEKSSILPLGADQISTVNHDFSSGLKLIYVGTLYGRDIHKTISGLKKFIDIYPNIPITYDIIGDAVDPDIILNLKKITKELNLNNIVTFHGRIPNSELTPFFDNCNIGVSFVPITPYYDHQPVTKSFEYIMSGLYTIATATYCNKEIITNVNGVLIEDNEEDFCKALEDIYLNKDNINCEKIRQSLIEYRWENIIINKLKPIIEQI